MLAKEAFSRVEEEKSQASKRKRTATGATPLGMWTEMGWGVQGDHFFGDQPVDASRRCLCVGRDVGGRRRFGDRRFGFQADELVAVGAADRAFFGRLGPGVNVTADRAAPAG